MNFHGTPIALLDSQHGALLHTKQLDYWQLPATVVWSFYTPEMVISHTKTSRTNMSSYQTNTNSSNIT